MAYVKGRSFRNEMQRFQGTVVPELPPDAHKQYLVKMIRDYHRRLQSEVYERNRAFINLSKLPHSRNIPDPGPDEQNVYVDYWKNGKIQLPKKDFDPKPLQSKHSGGGSSTANVLPSTRKRPADAVDIQPIGGPNTKRLRTPYDITEDESLADMLEETAAALKSYQDDIHSLGHLRGVSPTNVPGHLNNGVTHDVPSTSSPTSLSHGQSNTYIPGVDQQLGACHSPSNSEDQNKHLAYYFDFDEWEKGRKCPG
ncbi:hypothetical protein H0H93_011852 [Arthromyces matolae]|nr:hypothetical protein H0H93_011852 [Arthromyces matolae]